MENSPQHVNAEVSTRKWAGRGKNQDHHDGIKKHIKFKKCHWEDEQDGVLWSHRTTPKGATNKHHSL